jgi:hypothetical protein
MPSALAGLNYLALLPGHIKLRVKSAREHAVLYVKQEDSGRTLGGMQALDRRLVAVVLTMEGQPASSIDGMSRLVLRSGTSTLCVARSKAWRRAVTRQCFCVTSAAYALYIIVYLLCNSGVLLYPTFGHT